jgi:hypothetical protein
VVSELSEGAARLIGTWRYVVTLIDGKQRDNRGANPQGIIIYQPSGHMAVQVVPDKPRGKAGTQPTAEECKAALADAIAYFGTFSVDEAARTVTHHRWGSIQPGDTGDLVRGFSFEGDRLILRPLGTTQDVVWERIA